MHPREMIPTHPGVQGNISEGLVRCIEKCFACPQTCTACADARLAEEMVEQLRQCIRYNLGCADVCAAAGRLPSRCTGANVQVLRRMPVTCMAARRVGGDECESHAGHHEYCRICAGSCRRCERACQAAMVAVG